MKDIYYKSSEGVIINLIQKPYKMLDDTDLFNWEWDYETAGSNYPYITAFKKQMVSKQFNLVISGSSETDMLNNIEHFVEVVDRDVRLNQAGKLYYGNYYRECFITGHTKGKFLKKNISTHGFTIVAEDGDWKSEETGLYEGLSGGAYLNSYAVPEVSSNSDDLIYANNVDEQGVITVPDDYYTRISIGSSDTIRIESLDKTIQYRTSPSGTVVDVTPNQCPYDIDVSDIPLYVNVSGYLVPAFIEVKATAISGTSTINYTLISNKNRTTIDWVNGPDDHQPVFVIDLGAPIEISQINNLTIAQGNNLTPDTDAMLSISPNGTDWTTVDTVSIPTTTGDIANLQKTWTSNYPTVRYIRITSSVVSGTSATRFGEYSVRTKHFQVKAHIEGEVQNLALASTAEVSGNANIGEWTIENDQRKFYVYASGSHSFTILLPHASNITDLFGVTATSSSSSETVKLEYIDNDNVAHTIHDFNVSTSGTTISFSNLEFDNVKAIRFRSNNSSGITYYGINVAILEEITESPHRYITNDNYIDCDAIITIYGPTSNPIISIGDNDYGAVNTTLDDGEKLEINTRDETVQKFTDDTWLNIYANRTDESFNKIPIGTSEILWNGNLKVEIEKLLTRSDPKWN